MLRPFRFIPFAVLPLLAGPASAITLTFDCITDFGISAACDVGEDQFSVDVTSTPTPTPTPQADDFESVSFAFSNVGSEAITIIGVYFDDGAGVLASLASVVDGVGVDFDRNGFPSNLPDGLSEGFLADFRATADHILQGDGVNPGEDVATDFTLTRGYTLGDVLTALTSQDLRVGVLAVAFPGQVNPLGSGCGPGCRHGEDCDDSGRFNFEIVSFINDPGVEVVPEPGALSLLSLALLGFFVRRR